MPIIILYVMALNFGSSFIQAKPFLLQKPKHLHLNLHISSASSPSNLLGATAALSEGTEAGNTDQEDFVTYSGTFSSARTRLDLLEQLTSSESIVDGSESDDSSTKLSIRDQLTLLVGDRDDDFSIPLSRNLKVKPKLTISQKRNIKRQSYLNEVARRNDSAFFATIGAFVLLTSRYTRNRCSNWLCATFAMMITSQS